MRPRLIVLAGPNGAGKSTLFQTRVVETFKEPFINADIIQRDELKDLDTHASYKAAEIAARRRSEMLKSGKSFATETVFSHPSKLALITDAQAHGYMVIVMHVGVDHPNLAVARVACRFEEGGHDVPDDKIIARYHRGLPLIRQAVLCADRGLVYDTSQLNEPPRQMLIFSKGYLTQVEARLPEWILSSYADDLTK
jgi:predicted ABC-type ATPase